MSCQSKLQILYISKKRRKQKRRSNQNRKRSDGTTTTGTTVGLPPHPQYPQHGHPQMPCGEYSQYPPNGWQNSLNPYGPQMHNNYNQLPYQGQLPNPAYYGMPFDPYGGQYQIAPGKYYRWLMRSDYNFHIRILPSNEWVS